MKFVKYLVFLGLFGAFAFDLVAMVVQEEVKEPKAKKAKREKVGHDSKESKKAVTLEQFSLEAINQELADISYGGACFQLRVIDTFTLKKRKHDFLCKIIHIGCDFGPGGFMPCGEVKIDIPTKNFLLSKTYLANIEIKEMKGIPRRIGLASFLILAALHDAWEESKCPNVYVKAVSDGSVAFFENKLPFEECETIEYGQQFSTQNLPGIMLKHGLALRESALQKFKAAAANLKTVKEEPKAKNKGTKRKAARKN